MKPRKPTADECSRNQLIQESATEVFRAIWYPQMGGYVGRAVIVFTKPEFAPPNACFDVYVWHDGEFPFHEDEERNPSRVHHCMAEQFVEFGKTVSELMKRGA